MKTIAIANQKGGTGKTTTAYNLGIALTQQGYRVLMVDFDPQSSSARAYVEFTQEVLGHGREEQVYERDEDARDR